MRYLARISAMIVAAATCLQAQGSPPPELCKVLRNFVESVQPHEEREFIFHTIWGANFKDTTEPAMYAKRCEHGGYEPAKMVCGYLMEHGSTEFAGVNAKNTIGCLSKGTRFAPLMKINSGEFSFSYGTEGRGALVEVVLQEDEKLGGMALRVAADGY